MSVTEIIIKERNINFLVLLNNSQRIIKLSHQDPQNLSSGLEKSRP